MFHIVRARVPLLPLLAFAWLLASWGPAGEGGIDRRQSSSSLSRGAVQSYQHTLPQAPEEGSTLVLLVCVRADRPTALSSGSVTQAGASWRRIEGAFHPNGLSSELWYTERVSAAASANIRIDWQADLAFAAASFAAEYRGLQSEKSLDRQASDDGRIGSTVATGRTLNTRWTQELWIGGVCARGEASFGADPQGFRRVDQARNGAGVAGALYERVVQEKGIAGFEVGIDPSLTGNGLVATLRGRKGSPGSPQLHVVREGSGMGWVQSDPAGISCGGRCAAEFRQGQAIRLSHASAPGVVFKGWKGASDCGDGVVMLREETTCVAVFEEPPAGDELFVRTDGDDQACLGTFDAPAAQAPRCALHSVQAAFDRMGRSGDDVTIKAGTYSGRVVTPGGIRGSATNPAVIRGDPAAPPDATRITCDPARDAECLLSPGGPSGSETTHLTIRHLAIGGGGKNNLRLGDDHRGFTKAHLEPVIEEVLFDATPAQCCTQGSVPRASALRIESGARCVVRGSRFIADRVTSINGIAGTDSMAIFLGCRDSVVERNEVRGFLGSFVQENGDRNVIQLNRVFDTACSGDDGCIQIYNDQDVVVRYNLFARVVPIQGSAVIRVRMTSEGEGGGAQPAGGYFYNNTFLGVDQGWLSDLDRNAIQVGADNSPADYAPIRIANNIISGFGETRNGPEYAIEVLGAPRSCADLTVAGQLYHDNEGDFLSRTACELDRPSVTGRDPGLDPAGAPRAGSNACTGGVVTVRAPDGDVSRSWVGAFQGACAGAR